MSIRSKQAEPTTTTMPQHSSTNNHEPCCQLIAQQPQQQLSLESMTMDPSSSNEQFDWLDDDDDDDVEEDDDHPPQGPGGSWFHDSIVSNDATVRHANTVMTTIGGTARTVSALSRGSISVFELRCEENPRPSPRDLAPHSTSTYSGSPTTTTSPDRLSSSSIDFLATIESSHNRSIEAPQSSAPTSAAAEDTTSTSSATWGRYVTSPLSDLQSRHSSGTGVPFSSTVRPEAHNNKSFGGNRDESHIFPQAAASSVTYSESATTSYTIQQQQLSASRPVFHPMGYPATTQSTTHWGGHDASNIKMESGHPLDSPLAEGKSLDGEDLIGDSSDDNNGHSRVFHSPIVLPLSTIDGVGMEGTIGTTVGGTAILGTPSTVSTAPSTDDASLGGEPLPFDRLTLRMDDTPPAPLFPRPRPSSQSGRNTPTTSHESSAASLHRRVQSWEAGVDPRSRAPQQQQHGHLSSDSSVVDTVPTSLTAIHPMPETGHFTMMNPSPIHSPSLTPQAAPNAWAAPMAGIQRVATFRKDAVSDPFGGSQHRFSHPLIPPSEAAWRQHQQQQQQRHSVGDASHPSFRHPSHLSHFDPKTGAPIQAPFASYPIPRKPAWQSPVPPPYGSKPGYPAPVAPPHTPPRSRNPRLSSTLSPHRASQAPNPSLLNSPGHGSVSQNRSASEILKTLLRKKACLYEPDTSRAVALVTWLVGRELALEFGYFSRQQLQSGVHACVASKIDSGAITRTKVNRCMQIILNSCFHYIIPRPDGTEECGDTFRQRFGRVASNDSVLLASLPAPWSNLHLDRDAILVACSKDDDSMTDRKRGSCVSPGSSPPLGSIPHEVSSPNKDADIDGDSKRAVLLCFNENVRAAEDVFRCHNEFIRDTANAAKLHLTTQEWLVFFGKEAATAPHLWGNIGIPVANSSGVASKNPDNVGRMSRNDLNKFRTTWCAKRYDHDRDQCGFAHVDVNGGWLRRNPSIYAHNDELCPYISTIVDKRIGPQYFVVNSCPNGVHCQFAHSQEEIDFHPNRYKTKTCPTMVQRGNCPVASVCPHSHPLLEMTTTTPHSKKPADGRHAPAAQRHGRQVQHASPGAGSKGVSILPMGSPMMYVSPAPVSSFDQSLGLPGLQSLFRRHCSVIQAHIGTKERSRCRCFYSLFGDDVGCSGDDGARPKSTGLPTEGSW